MTGRTFSMIWLIVVSFFLLDELQFVPPSILPTFGQQVAKAQDPVLEPPGKPLETGKGGLYGRVTYNNLPVERARIILSDNARALLTVKDVSYYADSNGYYFFSNLSPGTYYLAAGWPFEEEYWFIKGRPGELLTGTKVTVHAGKYSQVSSLPIYVTIELEDPSDGVTLSKDPPAFRWSGHEFLDKYELSLVRRDINADSLKGEVILRRNIVKGTEFRMKRPLSPGIYWWTVSATDGEKTITSCKYNGFAGIPVRLPGEGDVSPLGCGNDFAVPSDTGEVDMRAQPTQRLAAVIPKSRWLKWNKPDKLIDVIEHQKRGIAIVITSDNIWKLGGSKQARSIVDSLLKPYAEKYKIRIRTGIVPNEFISKVLEMGLFDCAFIWCSDHPCQPGPGLQLSDMKVLDLSEETTALAARTCFYLKAAGISVGTYADQKREIQTVGVYR